MNPPASYRLVVAAGGNAFLGSFTAGVSFFLQAKEAAGHLATSCNMPARTLLFAGAAHAQTSGKNVGRLNYYPVCS